MIELIVHETDESSIDSEKFALDFFILSISVIVFFFSRSNVFFGKTNDRTQF
jgi:hypothetical protein